MAVQVTKLLPAHFVSTETRQKIHRLTDRPGGPTMAEREAFAKRRGERNVTKYWSVPTVIAACDLWGIEPVLNKGGRKYVAKMGGLTYSGGKVPPTEPPTPKEESDMGRFDKPKVFVGSEAGSSEPDPQAGDPNSERQRKLEALRDLVRREIEAARESDNKVLQDLIAGVSKSAAGAAIETIGKQLLAQLEANAEERLAKVIELIDEVRPVEIRVAVGDGEAHKVTGKTHPAFQRVLKLAAVGKNIALIGPTGSGKTHLCAQVAEALSRPFATVSCTMGQSESKLVGGLLPIGEGGKFEPYISDFVRLYRDGGVFLLDEYDAIDPNVSLILNQALANGHIDLPIIGTVKRHKDFVCVAALNTYGTGADRQYVGRSQLDEAALDRFRIGQVEMDYDRGLEKDLIGPNPEHRAWLERAWQVRDAIAKSRLRRNMSTRFILDGRDMLAAGDTVEQVLTTFVSGWSDDEVAKIGVKRVELY